MRVEGWESLLAEHVREAYGIPFQWGTHDCAIWAARWVRTCTGKDFLSDWEGKYKTEAGAKRMMKRRGYDSVAEIADEHLVEIPVALARRGDLLLHPQGHLGVCFGRHGFFLAEHDVTMLGTLHCTKAWAVG
jgi:hypothetical protein